MSNSSTSPENNIYILCILALVLIPLSTVFIIRHISNHTREMHLAVLQNRDPLPEVERQRNINWLINNYQQVNPAAARIMLEHLTGRIITHGHVA